MFQKLCIMFSRILWINWCNVFFLNWISGYLTSGFNLLIICLNFSNKPAGCPDSQPLRTLLWHGKSYRVFINILLFLNSARYPGDLPHLMTWHRNTGTEGNSAYKPVHTLTESRIYFSIFEKTQYLMNYCICHYLWFLGFLVSFRV